MIDENKAIKNVKNYFKVDFTRLKARSHILLTDLEHPSFENVIVDVCTNANDVNVMTLQQAKDYVIKTYNCINKSSKNI